MNEDQTTDYGILIAKKSEKLVSALYLVTDLMNDNEPIKHGLRKNAVALLSSMNSLAQLDVKDRVIELKMSLKSVTEITSLLHVAVTTGIVSKMNGELLMEGFRSLQLVLEKKQPIFTKEMLHVENEEILEKESSFSSAVNSTSYDAITPLSIARLHESKDELKRNIEMLRQSKLLAKLESKGQNKEVNIKDKNEEQTQNIKDINPTKKMNDIRTSSTRSVLMQHAYKSPSQTTTTSFQMKKISRRDQILALFIKGVDVSIKDIATRIKGCSEKTIQRELNSLLSDGVIDRIGEKRWSRYVLK